MGLGSAFTLVFVMSVVSDILSDAAAPLAMALVGQSVTYIDGQTDAVTVTAMVGAELVTAERGEEGRELNVRERVVTVSTDVTAESGGLANPLAGGTVTLTDGTRWTVKRGGVVRKGGNLADLTCVYAGLIDHSRPGYR